MVVFMAQYYCLQEVHSLARAQRIEYFGRAVSRDAAELGYFLEDVVRCVLNITEDEFGKTLRYDTGPVFDVYLTKCPRPHYEGELDELYVKLALVKNRSVLALASFHLQRFG